ncbi:MAG: bifunctional glutamate N-acetyltransferase/amino-acid acetyltransferase ArgJ [Sciscionella sp.]
MNQPINRDASVTVPRGFRAAGVAAGIKPSGALDLALVVNDGPDFAAAGVFTRNVIKAAPVLWTQEVLRHKRLRAVVLNSGGANAATGPGGFQDTHVTAERVGELVETGAIEIAACSTGLIGERLPMAAVLSGVDAAATALDSGNEAGFAAASAVLTTDSRAKQASATHQDGWSIGGFAKGAGMLAPNLATMLSIITTDAVLTGDALDAALRAAARVTFNRLDVDGGTSTNDTVLLLASGASGVAPGTEAFSELLTAVSLDLVRQLRSDSEGATKEVDVDVRGAATEADAIAVGRTVAEDNLVKTALFGSDPNWGRIAMALGRAAAEINPATVSIGINGVTLFAAGTTVADRTAVDLSGRDVTIVIDLGIGDAAATIFTTDLSHEYVEENSAYSS